MTANIEKLTVFEDARTGNRFVPYATSKGVELDCLFDGEQPWFTQADLAAMFGVDVTVVNRHITKFSDDGELDGATIANFAIVRREGTREVTRNVQHYGLDVAFYVGYRVNSTEGKLFRRWATAMLVQLAAKGFVVHERRLKGGENAERIQELRQIITDLRSEEANLYAELRSICAMCQDYEPDSPGARKFYEHTQAKIFFAVTSMTPAQLIAARADADKPNMGLETWKGERIQSADVTVGKNYTSTGEKRELSRLVGILLDSFWDQLDLGRLTTMNEAARLLDQQLRSLGRVVLDKPGAPSATDAKAHAKAQYKLFDTRRRALEAQRVDAELEQLRSAAQALPKPRSRGRKKPQM